LLKAWFAPTAILFRTQSIRVYFLGTEDSSLQTSFVIDDTAVNVQ